jgi:Tol biopolymer transport system component
MTDLDTLARAATQELLERTTPDVRSRYADLRRTRTRRTTAKLAAAGAVAALAVGGWQLGGPREQTIEPAPQPGPPRNGTLLALPAEEVGPGAHWSAILGALPAHLPDDAALFAQYQFTAYGNEIVYADRRARINAVEVLTGRSRTLVDCPDDICAAVLSPDGGTVASIGGGQIRLQSVGSGALTTIPMTEAVAPTGAPAWSPDGTSLAFADDRGVYVAELDSGQVSAVRAVGEPGSVSGPVSWSPDGSSLAYFETRAIQPHGKDGVAYTAAVIDRATGTTTRLLDAGHCGCAGLAAPSLTWSPDGQHVAVAISRGSELPWGVYLVRPDGSGVEELVSGSYAALAWQPLRG